MYSQLCRWLSALEEHSQQAPEQDVLLKLHFLNVVFKENDNFQRRILSREDKPEYGGGQNKNDARLGEEK